MAQNEVQPSQILDFLFLGSFASAKSLNSLLKLGVKGVVNCTDEAEVYPDKFEYLNICIEDEPSVEISPYFDRCVNFIEKYRKRKENVLVHCHFGISRSATIVIAYIMKTQKWTLRQAYYHVLNLRPVIEPNEGFWAQLLEYEKKLFGKESMTRKSGKQPPMPIEDGSEKKEKDKNEKCNIS
eukprot:TRINITY_DN2946_c0_g1_i1.p1 TRINITY_DN2946_c0_g1~~TRINITY_DN2946_c0_g1_i1.p1  ORF type:complete len:196 (-),score=30.83 TRINITY_DN2946_c0_g1_i1:145-690(-)